MGKSGQQCWKVVSESRVGVSSWFGGLWGSHGRFSEEAETKELAKEAAQRRLSSTWILTTGPQKRRLVHERTPLWTDKHIGPRGFQELAPSLRASLGWIRIGTHMLLFQAQHSFHFGRGGLDFSRGHGMGKRQMAPLGPLRSKWTALEWQWLCISNYVSLRWRCVQSSAERICTLISWLHSRLFGMSYHKEKKHLCLDFATGI